MSVLSPSCRVEVCGLSARPELNGRIGTVARYVQDKVRWEVLLDGSEPTAAPLGLRACNAKPLLKGLELKCSICLTLLGSADETEKLECPHNFHAECVQEMRENGAVEVCPHCRWAEVGPRSVQWMVDEVSTLIIQADRAPPDSKPVKALTQYNADLLIEASACPVSEASAHNNLGIILERTGMKHQALAVYKAAIAVHPQDAALCVSLGSILGETQDFDGAAEAYRKAVAIDPQDLQSHCSLGVMLQQKGDIPDAIAAFREARELDPTDANVHQSLGMMLSFSGDLDAASESFLAATKACPGDSDMLCSLGDCLKEKGDIQGAIAAFQEALEVNPELDAGRKAELKRLLLERREAPSGVGAATEDERRCEIEKRRAQLSAVQQEVVAAEIQ